MCKTRSEEKPRFQWMDCLHLHLVLQDAIYEPILFAALSNEVNDTQGVKLNVDIHFSFLSSAFRSGFLFNAFHFKRTTYTNHKSRLSLK